MSLSAREPVRLDEMTCMLRSKNAGTFTTTFDVIAADEQAYARIEASEQISPEVLAGLYSVAPEEVEIHWIPALRAVKINIPRPCSTGAPADRDVYGCQQHAPLAGLRI